MDFFILLQKFTVCKIIYPVCNQALKLRFYSKELIFPSHRSEKTGLPKFFLVGNGITTPW